MSAINNRTITLVENGKPSSAIMLSGSASNAELSAAAELQRYLEKITKVQIPIITPEEDSNVFLILVGTINREYSNCEIPQLPAESFLIQSKGRCLHIFGADDDGLLFGIYTFLEKFCGVRWFWPGELGEVVQETDKLTLDEINLLETPDFKWRNRGPGGPLWGSLDRISMMRRLGVSERHITDVALWEKRNKFGGLKIHGGHAWGNIVPPAKYGHDHPEYFALVNGQRDADADKFDGKHGAQLCTTNPGLIPIFTAYIDDFFKRHPDYKAIHITPNDGGRFCECNECCSLDSGKRWKNNPKKPVITDRIFTFVNSVAREMKKNHPDKYLVNMAYSWYTDPPDKIKIDDQVIPQYCLWSCYLHSDEEKKKEHYDLAKGWTEVANQLAIYEYFINGAWPDLPRIFYTQIADSIRYLYSNGINLYQTQSGDGFAINGLNYYIASKLLWNVDTDVKELIDDYYEKAFSEAAPWVRKYHERLQEAWQNAVEHHQVPSCSSLAMTNVQEVYPMGLLEDCRGYLRTASSLTNDPLVKGRIGFLEEGLMYVTLTIKAVVLTKELERLGIPVTSVTITDEEELIDLHNEANLGSKLYEKGDRLLADAIQAWMDRDRYVESLRDDYVISYFWIKYNDKNRAFNPLQRLLELSRRAT